MKTIKNIFRNLIAVLILTILLGHAICSHSHAHEEHSTGIQISNDLSEFLKNIFSVNIGDGHLENYRTEKNFCNANHHLYSIGFLMVYQAQPLILPQPKELSLSRIYYAIEAPEIQEQIVESVAPLRGSPIAS